MSLHNIVSDKTGRLELIKVVAIVIHVALMKLLALIKYICIILSKASFKQSKNMYYYLIEVSNVSMKNHRQPMTSIQ